MGKFRVKRLVEEMDTAIGPVFNKYKKMNTMLGTYDDADKNLVFARNHMINFEFVVALEYLELADYSYDYLGDYVGRSFCAILASACYRSLKDRDNAVESIRRAIAFASKADDDYMTVWAECSASVICNMFFGDNSCIPLRSDEELYAMCKGNPLLEGHYFHMRAFVDDIRGNKIGYLENCEKAYEAFREHYKNPEARNVMIASLSLADAQLDNGKSEESEKLLSSIECHAKKTGDLQILLPTLEIFAHLYYRRRDYKQAFEVLRRFSMCFHDWIDERFKAPEDENEDLRHKLEVAQDDIMVKNGELIEKQLVLERLVSTQRMVQRIGSKLTSTGDIDEIFDIVCDSSKELFVFDGLSFAFVEDEYIVIRHIYRKDNVKPDLPLYIPITSRRHMIPYCLKNNIDMMCNSVEEYFSHVSIDEESVREALRYPFFQSSMYIRLIHEGRTFGFITAQKLEPYAYTTFDFDAVKGVASFVAIALNNSNKTKLIEEKARELEVITRKDELTWLENRRSYNLYVEELQNLDKEYILIFADMNHLKVINDGQGHVAGDGYLIGIAEIFRSTVSSERCFRLSGDEFAIIVEEVNLENVYHLVRRIKEKCQSKFLGEYPLSLSIGCAIRKQGENPDRVFTVAEARMYLDKHDYHWRRSQRLKESEQEQP